MPVITHSIFALYNCGMGQSKFSGKVALQQRVLPAYRVPFFDALADACAEGLSVFAGDPLPQENIKKSEGLRVARYFRARNNHFMDPGSPFYTCRQGGILEWLEEWQPDVLIVEANPRYLSTNDAIRWMRDRKKSVIGWGLGAPPQSGLLGGWRRRRRLRLLRSFDAVIAYSHRGAQEYRSLGMPPERVFVAANAVSPRPTNPLPERSSTFDGQPKLLFVGRLQSRKRIDVLLNACAALPESLQPSLSIVGDGPAREEFEKNAQEVYSRAEFLGAKFGSDLEAQFRQADLFVLPGTGGLAVQQAMAFGLPIIVAQGDGTQEDLVRADNGWMIPAGDSQALKNILLEALSDPTRLRDMGAASYRLVMDEFNLEAMVEAFVRVLTSVQSEYR